MRVCVCLLAKFERNSFNILWDQTKHFETHRCVSANLNVNTVNLWMDNYFFTNFFPITPPLPAGFRLLEPAASESPVRLGPATVDPVIAMFGKAPLLFRPCGHKIYAGIDGLVILFNVNLDISVILVSFRLDLDKTRIKLVCVFMCVRACLSVCMSMCAHVCACLPFVCLGARVYRKYQI